MYWDSSYILVIIGALICGLASLNVNGSFKKYSRIYNRRGITGREVAEMILSQAGIYDVRIEHISGNLTDHYSPNEKVLRLSDSVINSPSVAALGVAAHECGHAIQHHQGSQFLNLRKASMPVAKLGSWVSFPLILLGMFLGQIGLAKLGIVLFTGVVLFQLLTLPVEFEASGKALNILANFNYLEHDELRGAKKVLTAAALTYVASLFSSILQLARLIMIVQGSDNRRRR